MRPPFAHAANISRAAANRLGGSVKGLGNRAAVVMRKSRCAQGAEFQFCCVVLRSLAHCNSLKATRCTSPMCLSQQTLLQSIEYRHLREVGSFLMLAKTGHKSGACWRSCYAVLDVPVGILSPAVSRVRMVRKKNAAT